MGFIRRKEPAKRPRLGRGGARDPFEHLHAEREQFEDEEPWFLAGDNDGANIDVQAGVSSNLDAADLVDAAQPDTSPAPAEALPHEGSPRRNDPLDDLFSTAPGAEPGDGWTPSGSGAEAPAAEPLRREPGGSDLPDLSPRPTSLPASPDPVNLPPEQHGYADPSTPVEEPTTFAPSAGPRHLAPGTEVEDHPSELLFAAEPAGPSSLSEPAPTDVPAAYQPPRHFPTEERLPLTEEDGGEPVEPFIPTGQPAQPDAVPPEADPDRSSGREDAVPARSPLADQRPLAPVDPVPSADPEDGSRLRADAAEDGLPAHDGGEHLRGDRLDIGELIEGPPFGRPETDDVPSPVHAGPPDDVLAAAVEVEEPPAPSPEPTELPAPSSDTTRPASPSLDPDDRDSQNGGGPTAPSGQLESALVASFRDLVAHQGPATTSSEDETTADATPDPFGDHVDPGAELPSDRVEPRRPRRAPRRPPGF